MVVRSETIQRTHKIRFKERVGTCFITHIERQKYLITATHIIKDINDYDTIQYYHNNKWIEADVTLVGHSPNSDISVLTDNSFSNTDENTPILSEANLTYGQDVYIIGFPRIIDTENSEIQKINRNFPLPTIKKGIVSYMGDMSHFIVDIQGNTGFSGAPVVFLPNEKNTRQIAGIVSSYKPEIKPVYKTELEAANDRAGNKPIGYYRSNSGLLKVYYIRHALELINHNKS